MTDNYQPEPDRQAMPAYGGPQNDTGHGAGGEPPIWAPWYGIPFVKAFARFWKKYATFSGRASRSEYWWWFLWAFIIGLVLSIIGSIIAVATGDYTATSQASSTGAHASFNTNSPIATGILGLWYLAILIPSIAIQVRRLHDGNFRGWWVLLNLIPFLGQIVVFIFTLLPSKPEGQRFDKPTAWGLTGEASDEW